MIRKLWIALAAAVAFVACNQSTAQDTADSQLQPPAVPQEELPAGSEVLTQGPVHEAFAKPVTTDPQAPLIVTQQPPDPIQEMPPEEKPAGADIVWVPGYWAWDEERNDFIWVSGCWRNAPPNTYWVPGHWLQLDTGWEWISGFWKPASDQDQQEIEYLPAPPAAVEVAPPGAAPTPDQVWVPGCWYWEQGQYVQRHGYWLAPHLGWVWVPSHYAWTPRGYIFCGGHWDHDLDNRGVLFTPAFFPPEVRLQVGFLFHPEVCVDVGMLRLNLFVNPRYNHYCFGDYYDDSYQRAGIYPWFKCQTVHTWYDPLFVYDRWHFGSTDKDWAKHQAQQFRARQKDRDLRPARTYEQLQVQAARLPAAKRAERPLAQTVRVYAAAQSTPVRFERISTTEREQLTTKSKDVASFRSQRNNWEATPGKPAPGPSARQPEPRAPARQPAPNPPAVTQRESRPEPKPAPARPTEPTSRQPARKPVAQPPRRTVAPVQPKPAPPVRVTQPEREVVSKPPIMPKPAETRYIPKASPPRPAPETRRAPAPNPAKSNASPTPTKK